MSTINVRGARMSLYEVVANRIQLYCVENEYGPIDDYFYCDLSLAEDAAKGFRVDHLDDEDDEQYIHMYVVEYDIEGGREAYADLDDAELYDLAEEINSQSLTQIRYYELTDSGWVEE